MIFILDLIWFTVAAILFCLVASAVVLAASFIYVCIKAAKKSTSGKDENDG